MAEIEIAPRRIQQYRWLLLSAAIGLLFLLLVVWLVSRDVSFHLVIEDDQLFVVQVGPLPFREEPYHSGEAFEAVSLPEGFDLEQVELGVCAVNTHCERELYDALVLFADHVINGESEDKVEQARNYLLRAQLIPNISLHEQEALEGIRGRLDELEADLLLEQSIADLQRVLRKLERAQIADPNSGKSTQREARIEAVRAALLQLSVHWESENSGTEGLL